MDQNPDPFLQALQAYKAAVLAKDLEAFLALYDEDIQVFDLWGAWTLRGIDAWRSMASDWFASTGDESIVVDIEQPGSLCNGDLAVGHALLTYTAFSADGIPLRSLDNRITASLRKMEGTWKIFHEHTSAPIDPASTRAMLKRERNS